MTANLLTEWARLLLGSIARAGVRDVVLSPGSRNTPFTWAALNESRLRCRTIIDERSAAFFAVGHARITGRPVLLVCTSGSAAANYFPAVVEAAESGTPLVVLTADRPLELQHAAAPQTIDQVRLYGGYARAYFDLGTADRHPAMLAALPRIAAQAVLASVTPLPGPVHVNARARKPLEPEAARGPEAEALRSAVDRLLDAAPRSFAGAAAPPKEGVEAVAAACRDARRGLIVCGPEAPWRAPDPRLVQRLARATGFPVAAETASQQRLGAIDDGGLTLDAFEILLAVPRFREDHAPDLVIQLGRPPTATGWKAYLDRWPEARRWVITAGGWPDPWASATGVLQADPGAAVEAVARALEGERPDRGGAESDGERARERTAWRDRLIRASALARVVIDDALAEGFSEAAAVRAVVERVPRGGILALGNSLPIREADLVTPSGDRGIVVWSQRGANGIDGLISGAAGAAAAAARPATLLLGDVSFAHDIGGLAAARDAGAPVTVVVLNNGGGRIFERLPIAERLRGDPAFEAWLTPPAVDIGAAAAAYGLPFSRAEDLPGLGAALEGAAGGGGAAVLEVVVSGEGPVAHERALLRRIEARLRP